MKAEERLRAVSAFGFTERQAGFLVTVMQHSGVCLGRHYCAFSGLTHGQKVHDFFTRLLETRMASAHGLGHNRARLYRVHHKALYQAIGEADNRFRKPVALPRAIERLMVLDAVIADRSLTWLGTERDKVAYFTARVARKDLPALTFRSDDEDNRAVLSGQTADWGDGRRSDACLSLPDHAARAGGLPPVPRASCRTAAWPSDVDHPVVDPVPPRGCDPELRGRLP